MGEMCGLGHGAATSEEVQGAMAAGRTGNDLHFSTALGCEETERFIR